MPFWKGKHVLLTGHTGIKGSWLSMWLHALGAKVTGYALPPPASPSLYDLCRVDDLVDSVISDVRLADTLSSALRKAKPQIVFHLAAQPIVRESYRNAPETYAVNVLGTVNLLEAVRGCPGVRSRVVGGQFLPQFGERSFLPMQPRDTPARGPLLKPDISKARSELGWAPRSSVGRALDETIGWTKAYARKKDLRTICLGQIAKYLETVVTEPS